MVGRADRQTQSLFPVRDKGGETNMAVKEMMKTLQVQHSQELAGGRIEIHSGWPGDLPDGRPGK